MGKRQASEGQALLDWTVMVYLAGDNNLTAECIYALNEMKRATVGDRIKIIAQFDPQDDFLPTRRYEITHDSNPGGLITNNRGGAPFTDESPKARLRNKARLEGLKAGKKAIADAAAQVLKEETSQTRPAVAFSLPVTNKIGDSIGQELLTGLEQLEDPASPGAQETDTGSPSTLYNFLSFCVAKFPAKHYMVVLSGHGSGTERDYLLKDESPAGYLTIQELRRALEDLQHDLGGYRKIDILGLDSCLMSMAEVCYELRNTANILIGCESYSPASGWPYHEILTCLRKETAKGEESLAERVAKGIVKEYVSFYTDYWLGGVSVDQSALDVGKVATLKIYIDELANMLNDILEADETARQFAEVLVLTHWETQSYNGEQFVDLVDFCNCLSARCSESSQIVELCQKIRDFVTSPAEGGPFVLKSCFSGPAYQYSHGVSIYFPWATVAPDYKELSFVKDTRDSGWAKFLATYTQKTRRAPREIPLPSNLAGVEPFGFTDIASFNTSSPPQRFRKTQGMGPGNPIYSMRNPPLIALPDECLGNKVRKNIVQGLIALLAEEKERRQSNQSST